jgi:hypothetical protein
VTNKAADRRRRLCYVCHVASVDIDWNQPALARLNLR